MFRTKVAEEIETRVLCTVIIYFYENCAVCEIMQKNIVQRGGPPMTTWSKRTVRCTLQATNTQTQDV